MPGEVSHDQKMRAQWRIELYKGKSKDSKYKDDIKEPGLLSRWPKFMDLQVKLPDPGETVALVEMRKMCPGKPATLEEIEEICWETPFCIPFWKGQNFDTDRTKFKWHLLSKALLGGTLLQVPPVTGFNWHLLSKVLLGGTLLQVPPVTVLNLSGIHCLRPFLGARFCRFLPWSR